MHRYRRKHRNVDITVLKRWGWQILQGLVYLVSEGQCSAGCTTNQTFDILA